MSLVGDITANWAHLSGLLDDVLLLPPAERQSYLLGLSGRNAALGAILRQLLEIEQALPQRFLEDGPVMDMSVAPLASLNVGDEVGPYRLLSNLGSGGMGSVWLAEKSDGSLKRKIALKLPRMPWIEGLTSQLLAERDILCALEHPHIARLYDAGLDTRGQPFIAMEYIEGAPIDEYCDHHKMSIAQRVRLFLQVLDAVQYAHTRLVIHRDLKPANILINKRGDAQLLDFGIAQLQPSASQSSPTRLPDDANEIRAHTLRYASPEQLRHERLTVASDIYSLAVTLYELLTGLSPYGAATDSRESLRTAVLNGQFIPLSDCRPSEEALMSRQTTARRFERLLSGDIAAILRKALSMEPSDRYLSVEAFSADLQRWLNLRPVRAIPPSAWYFIRKFLQRNPWPVVITTVSTIAISALIIIAVSNADRAREEYLRATTTKEFLLNIFDAASPEHHEGRHITAQELLMLMEGNLDKHLPEDGYLRAEILSSMTSLALRINNVDIARRLLKERSRAYLSVGEKQSFILSTLEEAYYALLKNEFGELRSLMRAIKNISDGLMLQDQKVSDINWYEAWLDIDSGDYENAKLKFEKSKDAAKDDFLRVILAERGIATSLSWGGDRQGAVNILLAAMSRLKEYGTENSEIYFRKIELLSDLYSLGEYKRGWEIAKNIIIDEGFIEIANDMKFSGFYEIWLNWFLKVEGVEGLSNWFKKNRETINSHEFFTSFPLFKAFEINDEEYSNFSQNLISKIEKSTNYYSLEYLIFEYELKIIGGAFFLSGSPELNGNWDLNNSRAIVYQSYFSGIYNFYNGDLLVAEGNFNEAHRSAELIFGDDHPETKRIQLAKFILNYVHRNSIPDKKILEEIKYIFEKCYGEKFHETQILSWWLSQGLDGVSSREVSERYLNRLNF